MLKEDQSNEQIKRDTLRQGSIRCDDNMQPTLCCSQAAAGFLCNRQTGGIGSRQLNSEICQAKTNKTSKNARDNESQHCPPSKLWMHAQAGFEKLKCRFNLVTGNFSNPGNWKLQDGLEASDDLHLPCCQRNTASACKRDLRHSLGAHCLLRLHGSHCVIKGYGLMAKKVSTASADSTWEKRLRNVSMRWYAYVRMQVDVCKGMNACKSKSWNHHAAWIAWWRAWIFVAESVDGIN